MRNRLAGQWLPCCVPGQSGQDGRAFVLRAAPLRLERSQPRCSPGCPRRLPALSGPGHRPRGCATVPGAVPPPGCRVPFPTAQLREGTRCSVSWLRTGRSRAISRSAGAGRGDPHLPSWLTLPCFSLEEQTKLQESLRTAPGGFYSRGFLQNSQSGSQRGGL